MKKRLYFIGGPMGIGKTTVSRILQKKLPNSVFLDGDWCWDASPFVVTEETREMVQANIAYLLRSFLACSAYENIIFCWVLHEQKIIDDLLSKIAPPSDCEVNVFSLISDQETLKHRLKKDIESGLRTSDVIQRSLARLSCYHYLQSEKIDTTGLSPAEVANVILQKHFGEDGIWL